MGSICFGSSSLDKYDGGTNRNRAVNEEVEQMKQEESKVHKLLLLGAGNSGKSTFFKQLTDIHGPGYPETSRTFHKQHIFDSILDQIKLIIDSVDETFEIDLREKCGATSDLWKAVVRILELPRDVEVAEDIAKDIQLIWANEDIKHAYNERTNLGIADSCPHFFDDIMRFAKSDYIPSIDDILLSRMPTTGIRQTEFTVEGDEFEVYDVGGQRNERNKWIHIFDNVNAVMFVASLACYDKTLFEETSKNAMIESLDLWEEVCNSVYFSGPKTSMIIFYNKKDLFQTKIMKKPITCLFEDFQDLTEEEKATVAPEDYASLCGEHISSKFLEKNKNVGKQIYTHFTCATDRTNVEKVFHDVQHSVVVNSLAKNGII